MSNADVASIESPEPREDSTAALAHLAFDVMGRLSTLASDEDMSLTQLRMVAIMRDGPRRMAQLAQALGVDRSSVSGLIARAEQRGLVYRESATGDGRGVSVALTAAGQDFSSRVIQRIAVVLQPLLAVLDDKDRQTFDALVTQLLGE
jgi:DNA-binding MarR family transcriptional regulator